MKLISSHLWTRIRLTDESDWREGPWTFASDGTIGAYPRFVNDQGAVVFLHAVAEAVR
jgi:hypothetical protein